MVKPSRKTVQQGHRYGEWVILSEAQRVGRDTRYLCRCSCGQERLVSGITLRNGQSAHCGCLRPERAPKVTDAESRPISTEIQDIIRLINEGYLPPADQFSARDGAPTWSLATIARILDLPCQELVQHLQRVGSRFGAQEPG